MSLGLLLPFGAGNFPDRAIAVITEAAAGTPAKHITFINGADRETVETRTTTVDEFLRERGITLQPEDSISSAAESAIAEGSTIAFRAAVPVNLVIDGVSRAVRTSAANIGAALAAQHISLGPHDRVDPAPQGAIEPNTTIRVARTTSWLERVRTAIEPPIRRTFDIGMRTGTQRVVDPGTSGTEETTVEVLQPNPAVAPKRLVLAARVLRFPRAKVIAQGVGDYSTLAGIAWRGTVRLADAALRMIATAYTGACSGCSGTTASGRPAGHGIVAVDPHYIPLGTLLYIPGYGRAFAGDTGGAIHGNRIDLGFDSSREAMIFGRRPIMVYVVK